MKYFENLYIGQDVPLSRSEILKRLQSEEAIKDWYFLIHKSDSNTVLEIIQGVFLESMYDQTWMNHQNVIVGVASKYQEAVLLTQIIIDEMYQQTGTFHLLQFMEDKNTKEKTEKDTE